MPLDDKRKRLFSDLGRPTRRGIRKCPKCGTINGTRGNSCKNKSCDVIFRDNGTKKKPTTDACKIILNNSNAEVFSVRLRDRGPDYRSFVQLPSSQPNRSGAAEVEFTTTYGTLPKCYVSACNRNRVFPCGHIKAAQKCFATSQRVLIKQTVLSSINIPHECKEVLSIFVNELPDLLVQRCSKTSFVVKCNTSTRHPLGYLHILFFKPNFGTPSSEPKFLCTCRPFKIPSKESEALRNSDIPIYDAPTKLCMHYYACISAFASNEELAAEFEYFLTYATCHDYSAGLLDQLHSVRLPSAPESDRDEETMQASHSMTADILRQNLSLLESIADGDDSNLQGVQCLEGVLSDQIIVTSVDDNLSFGDSSALDGLDEPDSQVCQIFSSQNLQLPHVFTRVAETNTSEADIQVLSTLPLNAAELAKCGQPLNEKRLLDSSEISRAGCGTNTSTCQALTTLKANTTSCMEVGTNASEPDNHSNATKPNSIRTMMAKQPFTINHDAALERKVLLLNFERWLASVNERINATMNYRLSGEPESLVYYICHEHFEILKDRITSGWKKKRLPNQTLSVSNVERAPVGNFTKFVWKITNIVHVLQIFHSTIVPLKINQFFVQNSSGDYKEWIPPKDDDSNKNKSIIPVLHSTSLKIGRLDLTAKENVPFSIEWIPDILPEAKHGELTLCFQFSHNGPIHTDEERRNSVAPLQKLIQGQTFPLH